ncbi:alginate lyase family protein [Nocardia vinacea]|uniref:alginate lyase family protein n=1 Tax=Nocardia vinacea TaxID=96468 RepID=UPI00344922F1
MRPRFGVVIAVAGLVVAACGGVTDANSVPASANQFVHPGVLVDQSQLEFVRDRVKAGAEPWISASHAVEQSKYADLSAVPVPRHVVDCGSYSKPDNGCSDEIHDAVSAYTEALLWTYTGDPRRADKAVEFMDAWSATIHDHTNSNARVQTAWAAEIWPKAAEIVRHTSDRWPADRIARFSDMLRTVYLPELVDGAPRENGNWELSMIDGAMQSAVFLDDRRLFDRAVAMWRNRVPAYFYSTSDGPLPLAPPGGMHDGPEKITQFWYGQTTFVDGLAQETCRDLVHTQWGLGAAIDAAETARHQGVDLYAAEQQRLTAAMEFHARYLAGTPPPHWLCGGKLNRITFEPTWDMAFNHYHSALGLDLPVTRQLLDFYRPTAVDHFLDWETLTTAGTENR